MQRERAWEGGDGAGGGGGGGCSTTVVGGQKTKGHCSFPSELNAMRG